MLLLSYISIILLCGVITVYTKHIDITENACKDIISYEFEEKNNKYVGLMKLPYDGSGKIELSVNTSIVGIHKGQKNKLTLLNRPKDLGDLLEIRLDFGTKFSLPKVIKIELNGQIYCESPSGSVSEKGLTFIWTQLKVKNLPKKKYNDLSRDKILSQYKTWEPFYDIAHKSFSDGKIQSTTDAVPKSLFKRDLYFKGYDQNPFLKDVKNSVTDVAPKNSFKNNPFLNRYDQKPCGNRNLITHAVPENLSQKHTFRKVYDQNPFFNGDINFLPEAALKNPLERNPFLKGFFNMSSTIKPTEKKEKHAKSPLPSTCGEMDFIDNRIFNGEFVNRGELPWLTAIFYFKDMKYIYHCAGSLITDRHILTAAHCFVIDNLRPKDFLFVLGTTNVLMLDNTDGAKTVQGKKLIMHPEYKKGFADADVAIAELEQKVAFSSVIKPVCLWEGSDELSGLIGESGTLAGWGMNEKLIVDLKEAKQVQLRIVDQKNCSRTFEHIATDRTFCAGQRDARGPCKGDSGSGFIVVHNNKYSIRGVVSMSKTDVFSVCNLNDVTIYTDVAKHMEWIIKNIE